MSRVIHVESGGRERTRLIKAIVLAIRELSRKSGITAETRDLVAFVALALEQIAAGVETTAAAWEKRDYWLKADRFRMEWAWCESLGAKMRQAVLAEDWALSAQIALQVAAKLSSIKVSDNHRLGKPWQGAYSRLLSQKS